MTKTALPMALIAALLCGCTGGPTDTTDTPDSDQPEDVPRVDLVAQWSATSLPPHSESDSGWWDFPWQDRETWCADLTPTDAEFLDSDSGDPVTCWEGAPSKCSQRVGFREDGSMDWTITSMQVVPCGGDERQRVYTPTTPISQVWSFLENDGSYDVFEVAGQRWRVGIEPDESQQYTVLVEDRTYSMTVQAREWR